MSLWPWRSGVCDRMWHSRVSGFDLVNVRLGCGPRDEVRNGSAVEYHSRDLEGWPLRAISFESWANERILCVDAQVRHHARPLTMVRGSGLKMLVGASSAGESQYFGYSTPNRDPRARRGCFSPNFMQVPPARTKTRMTFVLCHNNVN